MGNWIRNTASYIATMKKIIWGVVILLLLNFSSMSVFAQTIGPDDPKTYYNIPDDGYVIVPIPFGFPYHGRVFTHSIFFDNGVVSFYDPLTEAARLGGQQYSAQPLNNNIGSQFYYSIMPLWTDLVGNADSRYYTQSDGGNYLRYTWENVQQWGYSDRPNTFSLDINRTGGIGIQYHQINIGDYPVTAGMTGNASLGEWTQIYHRPWGGYTSTGDISNWGVASTLDCSSALNDPSCPGYNEAYLQQQCTVSALYSTSCPGYQQAYYDQQCSIDPLYDVNCPGYAAAYYDYQCSLDPLYHTGCPEYETAYVNQQCSIDPLYRTTCDGYAQAYFDQQCLLNGLYSNQCPNYATAYTTTNLLTTNNTTTSTMLLAQATTDPVAQAAPLVADPVVNSVVTAKPATTADTNPAAPVKLTAPAPAASAQDSSRREKKSGSSSGSTQSAKKDNKSKTAREQLAEKQREKAQADAVARGKELANAMGKAADMAAQIEIQNVVVQAMGFLPGFDIYNRATLPDGPMYKPYEAYPGQRNIDTPASRGLFGGSDSVYQQIIDSQYNLGK
jgi:hypothetical protein